MTTVLCKGCGGFCAEGDIYCGRECEEKANVKERPILFKGQLVRAILAGAKTETRRVLKFRHASEEHEFCQSMYDAPGREAINLVGAALFGCDADEAREDHTHMCAVRCPYGRRGDRLWVRETWATQVCYDGYKPSVLGCEAGPISYRAGGGPGEDRGKWRPSIFMPRWISRILLEVTEVRVERAQDIDEDGAVAEGCSWDNPIADGSARAEFAHLWDSINAKRGPFAWDENPWVWVVKFKRLDLARVGAGKTEAVPVTEL